MRDKILNIIGYLTQSLQKNKDLFYDAQEIWEDLTRMGFSEDEIETTLGHLEKMLLEVPGPFWSHILPVYRVYTKEESTQLSVKTRSYLWRLKSRGVIDHAIEDEIVQKAMNLEDPPSLKEIKMVAALTIFGYEHKAQGSSIAYLSYLN